MSVTIAQQKPIARSSTATPTPSCLGSPRRPAVGDLALSWRAEVVGAQWRYHFQSISNNRRMGARSSVCDLPDEPVALYAGGTASFVQCGTDRRSAKREHIKNSIQRGDVRLVCATDAACEGLNLQRLGAQINVDLPWNPSRLEQRKGRVQRIGQARDDVHILSLRYAGTVEDQVYATLSARLWRYSRCSASCRTASRISGSMPSSGIVMP